MAKDFRHWMHTHHAEALPRLATGHRGLAWADIKPLIERHLGDLAIPITVYTSDQRDVAAAE